MVKVFEGMKWVIQNEINGKIISNYLSVKNRLLKSLAG